MGSKALSWDCSGNCGEEEVKVLTFYVSAILAQARPCNNVAFPSMCFPNDNCFGWKITCVQKSYEKSFLSSGISDDLIAHYVCDHFLY